MIIDAFLYNGEHELLEARVHEWEHVADVHHVGVTFGETFSGMTQPFHTYPPMPRLTMCTQNRLVGDDAWEREAYARRTLQEMVAELRRPEGDDLVFVCDGDEIVKSARLAEIERATVLAPWTLGGPQHYYDMRTVVVDPGYFHRARACRWRDLDDITFAELVDGMWATIGDSVWHYSMLGGARRVWEKLHAFSHFADFGGVTVADVQRVIAQRLDVCTLGGPYPPRPLADSPVEPPRWLRVQALSRWPYLLDALDTTGEP